MPSLANKHLNQEQRRSVVEALATGIREAAIDVACPDWIHEARMFVTNPNGKDGARAGEHDDDVMCGAMAWYALPGSEGVSTADAPPMPTARLALVEARRRGVNRSVRRRGASAKRLRPRSTRGKAIFPLSPNLALPIQPR